MENMGAAVKGMYRDILLNTNQQVIFDSGWQSNTIVEHGRILLAAFMKGDTRAAGIKYMAVGRGSESWGTVPPAADPGAIGLQDAYEHKFIFQPADIFYVDDQGNPSQVPTRKLKIQATFGPALPAAAPCPLREFGLFGRFEGADFMINCVRHPLIQKSSEDTLVRAVQLYF